MLGYAGLACALIFLMYNLLIVRMFDEPQNGRQDFSKVLNILVPISHPYEDVIWKEARPGPVL
jgi:hypothetical protein